MQGFRGQNLPGPARPFGGQGPRRPKLPPGPTRGGDGTGGAPRAGRPLRGARLQPSPVAGPRGVQHGYLHPVPGAGPRPGSGLWRPRRTVAASPGRKVDYRRCRHLAGPPGEGLEGRTHGCTPRPCTESLALWKSTGQVPRLFPKGVPCRWRHGRGNGPSFIRPASSAWVASTKRAACARDES